MYVEKGLQSNLDGITPLLKEEVAFATWEVKDAQIMSWILSIINPKWSIICGLLQLFLNKCGIICSAFIVKTIPPSIFSLKGR